MTNAISVPKNIVPIDGRFGCGPSLIRKDSVSKLAASPLLGTSHRRDGVKNKVASVTSRLTTLLNVPHDYTVALGNGGATAFWSVATASLVDHRAAHAVFGSFGKKFATETSSCPFLQPSLIHDSTPGTLATLWDDDVDLGDADLFAYPHHETSTGVISDVKRVSSEGLTVVDATSIAGAAAVDFTNVDVYYFSPQKVFASEGGLWFAILSPAAFERAQRITTDKPGNRWIPSFLDLSVAIANSQKNQTLNTPSISTLELMDAQLEWLLDNGGLDFAAARSKASSSVLYEWAEKTSWTRPFVDNPQWRSPVVVTIDLEGVDSAEFISQCRANGIVDIDPYRSLGRNQIRVGVFPAVDPEDTKRLVASFDYIGERLID